LVHGRRRTSRKDHSVLSDRVDTEMSESDDDDENSVHVRRQ
jgi:hypothetical protein